MSFRFRVTEIWPVLGKGRFIVHGVLEQGKIVPPAAARVAEFPEVEVRILGIGLGTVLLDKPREFSLLLEENPRLAPERLLGCVLLGRDDAPA